jgi:hypothetical protein
MQAETSRQEREATCMHGKSPTPSPLTDDFAAGMEGAGMDVKISGWAGGCGLRLSVAGLAGDWADNALLIRHRALSAPSLALLLEQTKQESAT